MFRLGFATLHNPALFVKLRNSDHYNRIEYYLDIIYMKYNFATINATHSNEFIFNGTIFMKDETEYKTR